MLRIDVSCCYALKTIYTINDVGIIKSITCLLKLKFTYDCV